MCYRPCCKLRVLPEALWESIKDSKQGNGVFPFVTARGGLGPKRTRVSKIEAIKEATDVLHGKETVRNSSVRAVRGDQARTSERVTGRMSVTCRWPCRLIWQNCLCHLHFNMISNFNLIYQHCRNLCLFHVCFSIFRSVKIPDLNNLMFSD